MSSPRVTTVLLPPAKGRSIGGDSRWPISRGMLREVSCDDKTGENSRPTIGEDSTPAHTAPCKSNGLASAVSSEPAIAQSHPQVEPQGGIHGIVRHKRRMR